MRKYSKWTAFIPGIERFKILDNKLSELFIWNINQSWTIKLDDIKTSQYVSSYSG